MFKSSKEGKILAKLFETYLKAHVKESSLALMLSSGMDSASIGFAATRLGIKINAFTFQVGDVQTFDSKHAESVADKMGWEWKLIKVPDDKHSLVKAITKMRDTYRCVKKVEYECFYPMLHVYKKVKDTCIATGLAADGYFVFSRRANIEGFGGPKSDPEKFYTYRKKYMKPLVYKGIDSLVPASYNPSGILQHDLYFQGHGQVHINPFLDKDVYKFFMQHDWLTLNTPTQKTHLVEAFADECTLVGRRNHRSYNTVSKITLVFEQLLVDPKYNPKGRKKVMHMVKDWQGMTFL